MIAALAVITVVADVVVVACHFLPQNRNIFAQQHLNSIQLKLLCVAHFSAFICFSCCASMLHPACLPLNFALCLWRCCTSALSLVFISLRLPLLLAAGWQLCLLVVMLAISVYIFAVVVVVLQFCFFFLVFALQLLLRFLARKCRQSIPGIRHRWCWRLTTIISLQVQQLG